MMLRDDQALKAKYRKIIYGLLCLIVSFLYAYFLSSLDMNAYVDRDNYLAYASFASNIFDRNLLNGFEYVLTNEPVWLGINSLISVFFDPEMVVRCIIFLSSFVTSFLVLRHKSKYFLILIIFLLMPQVLKNNVIQLRQGMGIAFFLLGWYSTRNVFRFLFFSLACLIHSSFFLIIPLLVFNKFYSKLSYMRYTQVVILVLLGIFVGLFGVDFASYFGARQGSEFNGLDANVSGFGFMFWILIAVVFFMEGKAFIKAHSLQFSIIILYLATYYLTVITARVFESGLLIVLLAGLSLTGNRKLVFISAIIFYFCLQWYLRIDLPGYGWGIENYS